MKVCNDFICVICKSILKVLDIYLELKFCLGDKGYNFRPRLFCMSSKTGIFTASEILSLTRMPSEPYPFPFVQSDIYSVEQPGKFLIYEC